MNKPDFISIPIGTGIVTPYIAVFGTLRSGQSNFKRYLAGKVDSKGVYRIPLMAMYKRSGGYIPHIVHTEDKLDSVVVEILKIDSKDIVEIYENNCQLDMLESAYSRAGVWNPYIFQLPNTNDFCKIYVNDTGNDVLSKWKISTGDFVVQNEIIDYQNIEDYAKKHVLS